MAEPAAPAEVALVEVGVVRPHPADPRVQLWAAVICRPVPAADLGVDVPRAVRVAPQPG